MAVDHLLPDRSYISNRLIELEPPEEQCRRNVWSLNTRGRLGDCKYWLLQTLNNLDTLIKKNKTKTMPDCFLTVDVSFYFFHVGSKFGRRSHLDKNHEASRPWGKIIVSKKADYW